MISGLIDLKYACFENECSEFGSTYMGIRLLPSNIYIEFLALLTFVSRILLLGPQNTFFLTYITTTMIVSRVLGTNFAVDISLLET